MPNIEKFAVIDTETNWDNALMSIGIVIADEETMSPLDAKYFIIAPEFERGGMYFDRLGMFEPFETLMRHELFKELVTLFEKHGVKKLFAYNARFDKGLLSELHCYEWFDIMGIAAYRQYNSRIPNSADCYKTGRLKTGFGVEPMLRMLSGEKDYFETHNAMIDALDELTIMRLLALPLNAYECAAVDR